MAVPRLCLCCAVVAAIVSLLNEYRLKEGLPRVGFVNPLLYQMAQEKPEVVTHTQAMQYNALSCILD